MLDIALVYLPHPFLKRPTSQVPMGLLALAAVLEEAGWELDVRNCSAMSEQDAINDLPEAELYGITATSMEIPLANRFAAGLKMRFPEAKVILGGPGTCTPDYVDRKAVDSVFSGEGDITILNVMKDMKAGALKPDYVGETAHCLEALPVPARGYLKDHLGGDVFAFNKRYAGDKSTTILTSRGCPFKCAFCAAPSMTYGGVRYRSPHSVRREMEDVIQEYGIRQFRVSDDMFTASKNHVMGVCEAIKGLGVAWRVSARTRPLDEDMLLAMRDAGCKELSFGVESFDDDVLRTLNKGATADDARRALELCHRHGVTGRILLMIRTPGQTAETVDKNIAALESLPQSIIACTSFVPVPGSAVWNDPDAYGVEILDTDLENYNFYFFGPDGENEIKPIIKIKDRPLEEFMEESERFRRWLAERGDLNRG